LLAGAAEGLGEAWSIALAERGMNVIMVDHQKDLMDALADRLEARYGIETRRLHLDLAEKDSVAEIMGVVKETSCRLMVYNAAYSRVKRFEEHTPEDLDAYMGVNASTPIHLVHGLVKLHAENPGQKKGIILMASLAGLWGAQLLATYGATKAFNILLAESLHHELKPQNFDVMACVAGATSTPAYLGTHPQYGSIRPSVMAPRQVPGGAMRALGKRALYIPGWNNRLTCFLLTRMLRRKTSSSLFNRTTGQMYPDA
jgi:hypothetical protein